VTVTVAHAKGATGTLSVTAKQARPRARHGARRAVKTLEVTRRRIAGRYRYRFTVRDGVYTVAATWTGTGRWATQTQTRTYRTR
jgi:hypothetical protein